MYNMTETDGMPTTERLPLLHADRAYDLFAALDPDEWSATDHSNRLRLLEIYTRRLGSNQNLKRSTRAAAAVAEWREGVWKPVAYNDLQPGDTIRVDSCKYAVIGRNPHHTNPFVVVDTEPARGGATPFNLYRYDNIERKTK